MRNSGKPGFLRQILSAEKSKLLTKTKTADTLNRERLLKVGNRDSSCKTVEVW